MADAPTDNAIAISTGIVGALHAAGVLQTQTPVNALVGVARSDEQAVAISAGILTALSAAGVLQTQGAPSAPTAPEPEVGDVMSVPIRQIAKFVGTSPSALKVQLTNADSPITYTLEFPPNDEIYLPEFHRLFTIERPIQIQAYLTVLAKQSASSYVCELTGLWVNAGFRS